MSNKYYRIVVNPMNYDGWFLGGPVNPKGEKIDPRKFVKGFFIEDLSEELVLPIKKKGQPLNFLLGSHDMPVVRQNIAEAIEKIVTKDVQRISVLIENGITGYEILNVIKRLDCVDENRSEAIRWTEADHRPDLAGKYRVIREMKLRYDLIDNAHIFRIQNYEIALIVSEKLKKILEELRTEGISFLPV